jgi:hypothetical protein
MSDHNILDGQLTSHGLSVERSKHRQAQLHRLTGIRAEPPIGGEGEFEDCCHTLPHRAMQVLASCPVRPSARADHPRELG